MLYRSENDWTAVRRNFGKARRVWILIGKLLRREGADLRVSAIFYQSVAQAVLLFGRNTWVLLAAISRKL